LFQRPRHHRDLLSFPTRRSSDLGTAIFLLLSSLRSQFMTGIELLSGGKVPYLKGNFLEKKLQMFKKYGKERLQQGILLIFETELDRKSTRLNSSHRTISYAVFCL